MIYMIENKWEQLIKLFIPRLPKPRTQTIMTTSNIRKETHTNSCNLHLQLGQVRAALGRSAGQLRPNRKGGGIVGAWCYMNCCIS